MVPPAPSNVRRLPLVATKPGGHCQITTRPGGNTPIAPKASPDCLQDLREALVSAGISDTAITIILRAWRSSTMAQYRAHWTRWVQFCRAREIPPLQASAPDLTAFLAQLFEQGLGYSSINTAKSAVVSLISTCSDSNTLASSVLLKKFMRGVFTARPALPKLQCTWDVSRVLRFLEKLSPPKALSLLWLSRKLAMLISLLSGHRGQSVHLLNLQDIDATESSLVIRFSSCLKQTRPGVHASEIVLPAYAKIGLCVVRTYLEYIKRTSALRAGKVTRLFLTSTRPHKAVSRDTISNWIKTTLRASGIDLHIFSSHSTRSAATSAALEAKVPLATILQTAGWSGDSSFRKFYNKPIIRDTTFADAILKLSAQRP